MTDPTRSGPPRRPSGTPRPRVTPERDGPPVCELLSIGREFLRGHLTPSNARELARGLTQRGGVVRRITVVGDSEAAVTAALREALERNPSLVVTTGGLGPAQDDRTLAAVAEVLGVPLEIHVEAKAQVEASFERMRRRHRVHDSGLTAAREKLCRTPRGGRPVANPIGVAPGVTIPLPGGATVICLPGRPDEARAVFDAALGELPAWRQTRAVAVREIEAPDSDESSLRPLIDRLVAEYPDVWISTRPGRRGRRATVMIEALGDSEGGADRAADETVRRLLALVSGAL